MDGRAPRSRRVFVANPFTTALLADLVGAPEFLVGVYLGRLYQRWADGQKSPLVRMGLGGAIFLLTALAGTGFRTLLFGEPAPGFLSFGFGVTVVSVGGRA